MSLKTESFMEKFDRLVHDDSEKQLMRGLGILRLFFIAFMVIYLAICLFSISVKLLDFVMLEGALSFVSIKVVLTDALFTLIVLAIVKALFIKNSFEYALTFLEIAFVVVIRKLILLDTVPEENMTLLILGAISTSLFVLIVYIQTKMREWKRQEKQDKAAAAIIV